MRESVIIKYLGIEFSPVSHAERLISALGGFLAILLILVISSRFVDGPDAALIVASMGASAVLLFAAPHGALAQPWNVLGGHLVSAVIGVSCARYIPGTVLAAAASVGIAIGAMHYLRCIHPPGGATALTAVVGGESLHALGYSYLLTPVLLNVAVILAVAVLFNALFNWRRYPASLSGKAPLPALTGKQYGPIEHADLVYALSQIDSFIDVTEEDLLRIYKLATRGTDTGNDNPNGSG
ncbi:MAG: HPP family protein [Thiohalobacterales bacterium]